jgi:polar amino acid transport system permease protein
VLDFEFIRDNWLFIAMGIGETLGIVIVSFLLAVPIGVMVARGRRSSFQPINALSTFYVWLIDGIPLLLLIFFIPLALPQLRIFLAGFWAAVLIIAVHYGSRMSKIFYERFALTGKSQGETRLSLIPPFANEFTSMIKDSTLISVTGVTHDVLWRATRVGRAEFKNFEALLIADIIYLILITIVSLGVKVFRTSMKTAESRTEGST